MVSEHWKDMRILDQAQSLQWLDDHGYQYTPPASQVFGEENNTCKTEVYLKLPPLKHTVLLKAPQLDVDHAEVCAQLTTWLTGECLLLIQYYCFDDGGGGMPEYLRAKFPGTEPPKDCMGILWSADEHGSLQPVLAPVFLDFLAENWQAYGLCGDHSSIVWLADEVIEARTDNQNLSDDLRELVLRQRPDALFD
jgi:hypothetical protein